MEGDRGKDSVLDYAVFQISSNKNSYEALISSEGKIEKLACGYLDQLVLHLPQAEGFQSNSYGSCFKLQLHKNFKGSSWFTKSTLARFLHIINSAEAIKSANEIANEISQLEDARRFHLTLYSKDNTDHSGGIAAGGHLKDVGLTQNIKVERGSSDATKNDLLRAMELRIMVLNEELMASFNQAAGGALSVKQISDLAAFSQHFEVRDLRGPLLKYLSLIPEDQVAESLVEKTISDDTGKDFEDTTEMCPPSPEFGKSKPVNNGISPVKIAQTERQSSTESESSESSDEDQAFTERSRPVIRSVTPRRSASPMRRIQIGRSGSRRSTALTIKSLNYFPARERVTSNRDEDGNNSGDEVTDQPTKKPENTVRRMSVQEAISLFESRQNDQSLDVQKRRASGEVSTNKAVLRRWSAGTSESLIHSQENSSEVISQNTCTNLIAEAGDNKLTGMKVESDNPPGNFSATGSETAQIVVPPEVEKMMIPSRRSPSKLATVQAEVIGDTATASTEWSRKKEEELNQMLMKMMESRPGKHRGASGGSGRSLSTSNEQRGGSYSQYKEKRDEKLRAENVKKHSMMEAQLKVLQETLKQNKADASKSGGTTKKLDLSSSSQRPRRNSSPPVLQKKEFPKSTVSRKASPKSSPLPTTRASWSSGTLQKASGTQPAKTSPRVISANTTPSRRKSQPTPSPTPPSPKTERSLHQPKGKPVAKIDVKPTIKDQGENKQKTTRTKKILKAKAPPANGDDSGLVTAKLSFYSKVTKKSSVVPLEAKPFLKKGSGTGAGVGPVTTKTRVTQSDDLSKRSDNIIEAEEKEPTPETTESTAKVLEVDLAQQANDVDENLDTSLDNDLNVEKTENLDQSLAEVDNGFKNSVELPVADIQPDEDIGISSDAWVEVEHQEVSTANDTGLSKVSVSAELASPPPSPSPHARHSLSQMLQADSNEPEIIEWGNSENPPAMIYHKDAPRGLKRLLKFGRKSKGEAYVTGLASPSIFSEGEDDTEDNRASNKKTLDTMRKTALQSKGYSQQKTMPSESLHGDSSKSAAEYHGVQNVLSGSDKFSEGNVSSTASSTKASRSFFSLSTFRSSKSSEAKPR